MFLKQNKWTGIKSDASPFVLMITFLLLFGVFELYSLSESAFYDVV